MAKIAADLERALLRRARHGERGSAAGRRLASGEGWSVDDVICTSGPADRAFEERHSRVSLAVVATGTFQYRSTTGRALMTPGSILLGSAGHCFECGHEHGAGDRCVAFNYAPSTSSESPRTRGLRDCARRFTTPSLPPLAESAGVVAGACAALVRQADVSWEELAVRLAARVARLASARRRAPAPASTRALARVTDVVRAVERMSAGTITLSHLASLAGLSPYHFLRTFERVTGLTPHQHVRRSRLREAATRLASEETKVIDVAYDSGFGDVSNFNRAFRGEFGVSPRAYRERQPL